MASGVMHYADMYAKYPQIEPVLGEIADLLHAGASLEMAVGHFESWMTTGVSAPDRAAVRGKMEQWARAVIGGMKEGG